MEDAPNLKGCRRRRGAASSSHMVQVSEFIFVVCFAVRVFFSVLSLVWVVLFHALLLERNICDSNVALEVYIYISVSVLQ